MKPIGVLTMTSFSVLLALAVAGSAWSQCPGVSHFEFTDNTDNNYSIVLTDGGSPCGPRLCDEIGVFDGDLCVGATVFNGSWPVAIVAWQDNNQTDEVDGYIPGNQISFRIWRQDSDEEENTLPQFSVGDGTFGFGFFCEVSFGPVHFPFVANTDANYSIVIEEGGTLCDLQSCDEIGVFDGDLCVGASVFDDTYPVALVAWADDLQTPEVDGYTAGHQMTFRVWRSSEDVEESAEPHLTTGNGNFGNGAFADLWLECPNNCCVGIAGNVDNDPTDFVDIGDLMALIDYLFIYFTLPICESEANVDGTPDGTIDLGDLTALIDYLFVTFVPPAECQ